MKTIAIILVLALSGCATQPPARQCQRIPDPPTSTLKAAKDAYTLELIRRYVDCATR